MEDDDFDMPTVDDFEEWIHEEDEEWEDDDDPDHDPDDAQGDDDDEDPQEKRIRTEEVTPHAWSPDPVGCPHECARAFSVAYIERAPISVLEGIHRDMFIALTDDFCRESECTEEMWDDVKMLAYSNPIYAAQADQLAMLTAAFAKSKLNKRHRRR